MHTQNGFTMLELTISVVIAAILAVMAVSYYEHAIENIRKADVVSLMGTEISAQDRYLLTKHHYTHHWHNLDTAPVHVRTPSANNPYANGLENTIFFTRGRRADGTLRQGFQVYFEEIGKSWFMTADRVGSEKYGYTLVRPFGSEQVYCLPTKDNDDSIAICTNFMGVEDAADLPEDPRLDAEWDEDEEEDEDEE